MKTIFGSDKIISFLNEKDNLNIYYAGFDLGEFRYEELNQKIVSALVDFAYGFHNGILENNYNLDIIREAAKSIYKIKEFNQAKEKYIDEDSEYDDSIDDKYLKRGEFGELILHLLLRDFHNSVPLLSKIYFKDSYGHAVHGFDAVHIAPDIKNDSKNSLWLGESKLYKSGKAGIKALTKDITEHFSKEYLKSEFALISKKKDSGYINLKKFKDKNSKAKYKDFLKCKDEWLDKLDNSEKLQDILSSVTIPMLCTYTSDTLSKHCDETKKEFLVDLKEEVTSIHECFIESLKIPIPFELNIVLLLFPVPSKKELVKKLHTKLGNMQNI